MPETTLNVTHRFHMRVSMAPPIIVGESMAGNRSIVYVTGGTISGPGMEASVIPGGGDWLLTDPKGEWFTLDVRIAAKTNDGANIYLRYVYTPSLMI
jgi:hypothetical protein